MTTAFLFADILGSLLAFDCHPYQSTVAAFYLSHGDAEPLRRTQKRCPRGGIRRVGYHMALRGGFIVDSVSSNHEHIPSTIANEITAGTSGLPEWRWQCSPPRRIAVAVLESQAQWTSDDVVYVVDISGEIDLGLAPYLERVLDEAAEADAAAVLIEIDTPAVGSTPSCRCRTRS